MRDNYSTDYFDDPHQGIPVDGYNRLFERMLDHENISVECNVDFNLELAAKWAQGGAKIFYSGPIDRLFDYKFGALPWRTLRFETEKLPVTDYQGNSVVNYPDVDVPYTRIHEFKHYHPEWDAKSKGEGQPRTIIMREYSDEWKKGDEPYYPIANPESAALLAKYQSEVEKFNHRSTTTTSNYNYLIIGGRLGGYKYYDMDQAMAAALEIEIPV